MKIYQVTDNGQLLTPVADLAELGKLFLKMSAKHPKADWYWVQTYEV